MSQLDLDTIDIHSTDLYVSRGYPWKEWDLLRKEAPVFWYEREGIDPFHAVTRHEDVLTISKNSDVFVNSRRLRLQDRSDDERQRRSIASRVASRGWDPNEPSDFILMDDPRHRDFRLLIAKRFTPVALRKLERHFAELSAQFAGELAVDLEATARRDRNTGVARAVEEMTEYMVRLIADREVRGPRGDDLSTQLIHSKLHGSRLTEQQLQGFLFVVLAAGNETTQNAISGGVHALLQNPAQRDLLCRHPELVVSAAEEILRWTSPVLQFARTAVEDFELAGVQIKAGEDVGMWYPSANRDEAVFDDPYVFDVTRDPNRHLAFGGYGAHFCLGANLARWELRAALRALIPVLPTMELAGQAQRVPNLHVSAIHRLPVRAAA